MTTTNEVRNMIKPWLTGNDEKDAKMLKNMFRGVGMSIREWRQVVKETKAAA
jgi:CCR4-NOT transcriptional regulation complex NOT5 subunit